MNLDRYSLWTAVVTPFEITGHVDFESLSSLVKAQERAGNGLLILGSTGEALNLNCATRKSIIEHVVKMKPSSPIMVGVGGNLLHEQKEWINYLEDLGVDAYLLVTPHYAKPGPHGQERWFKELMDSSSKPCVLYNVPGRTGTPLSLQAVKNLNSHQNFWGIKEASGSVEKFKEYLQAAPGKKLFCGDDALMPDFAMAGASGLISVASNVWPAETHRYVKECLAKTFDAKELWSNASNALFVASNPVPVKWLMHELKFIQTPLMTPPLSDKDMVSHETVMRANREVSRWFKGE